jgi:tRNA nucleotidyltransferase (CCA-adding enzyme)
MKNALSQLPKEIQGPIKKASDLAQSGNLSVYLVGGFVRDLLLDKPNLDLDIVVEGDGIRFAELFASSLKAELIRHARFGTATVILGPHLKIDFASARKESYPQPGHLPVVSPGTLRDDLYRRDFTINAMAMRLRPDNFGEIVDFFHGQEDLKKKKIRILHSRSFLDDPTRILRAVRFEQRYGFKLEPLTLKCLKQAVKTKMLPKVQPQRVRDDLILLLKEKRPLKGIRRLGNLSCLDFISHKLVPDKPTGALLSSIEKQVLWFLRAHHQRRRLDAWLIYLMGLLDPLPLSEVRRICRRFAFRKGEEKRILDLKKTRPGFLRDLSKKGLLPSRVYALLEPLSYETTLLLKSKYKNAYLQKHIKDFLNTYNHVRLHICGDDLCRCGKRPGPDFQSIFKKILNAKLDGLIRTREDELRYAGKLCKRRNKI